MASTQRFSELRMEAVSRRFGAQLALDEFDLTVTGGEFIALLGPSGCGKSTALNCLAGLLPLTGGGIWLDEQRVDGLPPERRGFGMVFQNYALFPHMSVRRNVAFGLRMHKVGREDARRRVDEAIQLVQLTPHADKYPGQLSGGQQQRVAIARAIVLEPPLVLMDEPLSNLDASLRLEMRTEVRRLHQTLALTTIYVTHDQEEALSLADRLVLLRDGRVQQIGSPEAVYAEPVNRYVAGFMGYRNMLELDVVSADGAHTALDAAGVRITGVNRDAPSSGRAVAAIRPDDFVVADDAGPQDNVVDVTVEVVEYHGRELAVQGRLPTGHAVHFRTGQRVKSGEALRLRVPRERVLVFAPDTTSGQLGASRPGYPAAEQQRHPEGRHEPEEVA